MSDQMMVKVEQLNKRFGAQRVIENLSFEMVPGERMALFAPSGAGKTTLIKILTGLEQADGGQIRLAANEPVTLFQEPRLFPYLTVKENIFLPFRVHSRQITEEVQHRYSQWLQVCELDDFAEHYPCQLSGGMRQKVALIRGLLGQPHFLMMDEPFQSINASAKETIISHIRTTLPECTILFVTHIIEEIPLLAQSVLYFACDYLCCPERLSPEAFRARLAFTSESRLRIRPIA